MKSQAVRLRLVGLALALLPSIARAVSVDLDPAFGSGGKRLLALSPSSGTDEAFAMTLDDEGRILVAGYSSGPRQQMAVARLDASGALDPSFGGVGYVKLDVGVRARAQAIALQPDGRIVVAGFAVLLPSGIEQFVAARLLDDGTLDPEFGEGGVVSTSFGTRDARAAAVALQPDDGAVVVAGWSRNTANRDLAVVRYGASGALDPTFGKGGKAIFAVGLNNDEVTAVAVQPDGRIVLAGYASDGSTFDFLAGRLTPTGAADPTFNGGGFRRVSTSEGVEQANALLLASDGGIVLAGQSKVSGTLRFALARVDGAGALDPSFGNGGVVTTPIGELAEGKALVPLSRGRLLVAGRARMPGGKLQFAAARYLASGALDTTFGTGGHVLVQLGNRNDEGYAAAVDDGGAILLAGTARTGGDADFGLARLLIDDCGDGFLDAGEACDGGAGPSCCSSSCTIAPAGETCRAAADACDVAETCDGIVGECPADDVLPDGDDDGVCDAQDVCPLDPDPLQQDGDGDGLGDACDPCTGGAPLERPTLRFGGLATPDADDTVKILGSVTLPGPTTLSPQTTGARVLVHAADGSLLFDAMLPPGVFDAATGTGWKVAPSGKVRKFQSRTAIGGLVRRLRILRAVKPGRYNLKIVGSSLDLAALPLSGALRVTVVLDPPGAAAGRCAELTFRPPQHACARDDDQGTLVCK
ncbi:hypothetical protein K2Z84_27535 [Candidatus Binatia bacterium]|nr:hypothetical protein [Candidatus Binatia bacterium]